MYLIGLTVELGLPDGCRRLEVVDSIFAHAAIMQTLTKADPEVGRALHDMRRNKRVTSAIINSQRSAATLRLTFIENPGFACANTLISALAAQPSLKIGGTICEIKAVNLASSSWAGVQTWTDLLSCELHHLMRFTFATPTAIIKCDSAGSRFTSVLPEPLDVFSGLLRRWEALEGPALPHGIDEYIRTGGCVVSQHQIQTVTFKTPTHTQKGFVGQVVFECRKRDERYVGALNALARFAFFAGVGYQTMRGMGTTKVRLSN